MNIEQNTIINTWQRNKRNCTNIEESLKTSAHTSPVIFKDNTPTDDIPNVWVKGTVYMNVINQKLLSQKIPIKVSQFLGAIVSGMYNHLKSILKQNKHQVKCLLTF